IGRVSTTTRLISAATGREVKSPVPDEVPVAFDANGKRVLTWSAKGGALWDVQSGKLVVRLKGRASNVKRAIFHDNSTRIYTVTKDAVCVYSAETGKPVRAVLLPPRQLIADPVERDGRHYLNWSETDDGYQIKLNSIDDGKSHLVCKIRKPLGTSRLWRALLSP